MIRYAFFFFPLLSDALVLCILVGLLHSNDYGDSKKEKWPARKRFIKTVSAIGIASAVLLTAIPSTKTAAAMILVPVIVNNEKLQEEAGELYMIAKEALKSAVSGEEKK